MLSKDDLKMAIDDARVRHAAVVQLIYFTDQQAMSLLTFYTTVGIAAATGAVAAWAGTTVVPHAAAWALGSAVPVAFVAALFCFFAMRTSKLSLPGRDAEFWLWALEPRVKRKDVFVAYLKNLRDKNGQLARLNKRTGYALRGAKISGMLLPLIALTVGLGTMWCGY
jgi:hypothetical protein